MKIKSFKDLVVWQKAHKLVLNIYETTNNFPKSEIFALISQMRRCAVSIPSNIAEGFGRKSVNDRVHFYNIAEGSLEELKYQVILSKDLKYIKEEEYKKIYSDLEEIGKLLNGWKKSQR